MSRYRVTNSAAVDEQFRAVMAEARARGILPAALRSAAWLMSELALTPSDVGESRDEFPRLGLRRRIHFTRPVSVLYAVHEESRTVFVLEFGLTGL